MVGVVAIANWFGLAKILGLAPGAVMTVGCRHIDFVFVSEERQDQAENEMSSHHVVSWGKPVGCHY